MSLNRIYGIIIALVGATNIYFGYAKLAKFSNSFVKALSKFGKADDLTVVLLVGGLICLVIGILQIIDRK